ncbi:hypothetical protein HDV03_001549 [Kappamyces sp. JEL0829]|nr:hypothetical protein HDV03_001549 [Kappamyces sp. JEL0829]
MWDVKDNSLVVSHVGIQDKEIVRILSIVAPGAKRSVVSADREVSSDDGWETEEEDREGHQPEARLITRLAIHECTISPEHIRMLFSVRMPHLLCLEFDRTMLGDAGLRSLCSVLGNLPELTIFSARRAGIAAINLGGFLSRIAIHGIKLEELYLSQNNIRDCGCRLLVQFARSNPSLKTLHISYNSIGICGATMLQDLLQNPMGSQLESLSFMCNPVGLEGLARIFKGLAHSTAMKSLIIGNTPPFDTYYLDFPAKYEGPERNQPIVCRESDTALSMLCDYLAGNHFLREMVVFGLPGSGLDDLANSLASNTLLESLTIPSTTEPIVQDLSPFLELVQRPSSCLDYCKIADGFHHVFESGDNPTSLSLKTGARNLLVKDMFVKRRLVWKMGHCLPLEMLDMVMDATLRGFFNARDRAALVSYLLDHSFLGVVPAARFSARNVLLHAYLSKPLYPRV